jgi:hypothetical protein
MKLSTKCPTPDAWQFLSNIEIADNGCWLWTGRITPQGYGVASGSGDETVAHRVAHIHMSRGGEKIGYRRSLDHTCHNEALAEGRCAGGPGCVHRRCVNPDHLDLTTPAENNRRASAARRAWRFRRADLDAFLEAGRTEAVRAEKVNQ